METGYRTTRRFAHVRYWGRRAGQMVLRWGQYNALAMGWVTEEEIDAWKR